MEGRHINSFFNIQVRVVSQQAVRELQRVEMQSRRTAMAATAMGNQSAMANALAGASMIKLGSQTQWAGRQLQYNFTLPLAIAGGAAVKWALDTESAMVRVNKVYGDGSRPVEAYAEELGKLEEAFTQLSQIMGVNRAEVIQIAGDWAAAGAEGYALAKNTRLAMEAMILGEMDAATATESLIAIQAQYRLDSEELASTLYELNMIENETGTTLNGLVQAMARAGGTARSAGVTTRELGAMVAALNPAAGSAVNAGNGLRTMLARLMAPTNEAARVMRMMGVEVDGVAWNSMTGTQRLQAMSDAFVDLDAATRGVVTRYVAGIWQFNRFSVLMDAMSDKTSFYHKALGAAADEQRNFNQAQQELQELLESNPRRLQIMWVTLQNGMADAIQPIIPHIIALTASVARMARAFTTLDPALQKFILYSVVALALLGPMMKLLGATGVLVGYLRVGFLGLGKGLLFVLSPLLMLGNGLRTFVAGGKAAQVGASQFTRALAKWPGIFVFIATAWGALIRSMGAGVALLARAVVIPAGKALLVLPGFMRTAALGVMAAAATMVTAVPQMITAMHFAVFSRSVAFNGAMAGVMGRLYLTIWAGWAAINAGVARAISFMHVMVFGGQLGLLGIFQRTWLGITTFMNGVYARMIGAHSAFWLWITAVQKASVVQLIMGFNGWLVSMYGSFAAFATKFRLTAMAAWTASMLTDLRKALVAKLVMWQTGLAAMLTSFRGWASAVILGWRWAFTIMLVDLRKFLTTLPALIARAWPKIIAAMAGPWGLAIAAIITVLALFHDEIAAAFRAVVDLIRGNQGPLADALGGFARFFQAMGDAIIDAFNRLPQGVQNALIAVVTMVRDAALKVYEWFSYLNPFARHSPSLVESVEAGMAYIRGQYASVGDAGRVFRRAAADLAAFKRLASTMGQGEWAGERANVASYGNPAALAAFDRLASNLRPLNSLLAEQARLVQSAEIRVARWAEKLDAANLKVDAAESKLSGLRDKLSALEGAYRDAEQAMQNYASAPLVGMRAMDDAIFANEMAQKRLRLEMLKMSDDAGMGVEDLKSRLASMRGDIEALRGTANDLRLAGAGSDVLGPINAEIAAMEAQYKALSQGSDTGLSELEKMQKELEKLEREGQILDLEQSIKFDPLTRQLEQLANMEKEITFATARKGILEQQRLMTQLAPQIAAVNTQIAAQESVVSSLVTTRDAINARYEAEKTQLDQLNEKYRFTESSIREIEQALRQMSQAAQDANSARDAATRARAGGAGGGLSPAEENFARSIGGDWEDPGGTGGSTSFGEGDLDKLLADWTKESGDILNSFDMWEPFRRHWNNFKSWWSTNVAEPWRQLMDDLGGAFGGVDFSSAGATWDLISEKAGAAWSAISSFGQSMWDLFGPTFKSLWDDLKKSVVDAWNDITEEFDTEEWSGIWEGIKEGLQNFWRIAKPILAVLGGVLIFAVVTAFRVLSNVIGDVIRFIGDVLSGLVTVIRGIIKIIVGIFSSDLMMIWDGIYDVFGGIGEIIWGILKGAWRLISGVVEGIVEGIRDFFVWLWDILVGHSIIPDMITAIIDWFRMLPGRLVQLVKDAVNGIVDWFSRLRDDVNRLVEVLIKLALLKWSNFKRDVIQRVVDIYTGVTTWWTNLRDEVNRIVETLAKLAILKWNNFKRDVVQRAMDIYTGVSTWWTNLRENVGRIIELLVKLALLKWTDFKRDIVQRSLEIYTSVRDRFNLIRDSIMNAFKFVRDKIGGIVTSISSKIAGGMNRAIDAVNKLLGGLNRIAEVLPGLNWKIPMIPKIATGGGGSASGPQALAAGGDIPSRRVMNGFKTSGARAIVGEGKPNYPEYVIPTDPTYRSRAKSLFAALGNRIGMEVPQYAKGGVLQSLSRMVGNVASTVKNGYDWGKDALKGAASTVLKPFTNMAADGIDKITWDYGKKLARYGLNEVTSWATTADDVYRKAAEGSGGAEGFTGGSGPWRRPGSGRVTSEFGIRVHPITGIKRLHNGIDLAAGFGKPILAARAGRVKRAAWTGGYGNFIQIDHGGGLVTGYAHLSTILKRVGDIVSAGQLIGKEGSTGNSTGPHLHFNAARNGVYINPRSLPISYDNGGVLKPGTGLYHNGTGKPEVVLTSAQWSAMADYFKTIRATDAGTLKGIHDGTAGARIATARITGPTTLVAHNVTQNTTVNFYGDLSFPNVKDGDDADSFIRNLSDLAGGQ